MSASPGEPRRAWLGVAARLLLGGVLLAAGLSKVTDLAGSGRAAAAYEIFPYDVARLIGGILPVIEIVLGVLLIVGFATRAMAVVAAVLMVIFIAGIASVWARGLSIDCGCFGGGGQRAGDQSRSYAWGIARDTGLLLVGAYLIRFPRTRLSLDERLLAAT